MYSGSDNEDAFLYRLQIISPLESVLCRILTRMGNLPVLELQQAGQYTSCGFDTMRDDNNRSVYFILFIYCVSIVTILRIDKRRIVIRFPAWKKDCSVL